MISRYLAKTSLMPMKRPILKTPADYGMNYNDITFMSDDGIKISAWLIKGSTNKLIIFNHPMPFNRYGFHTKNQGLFKISDIEVELLKVVKTLNEAGYSILTMDMRNHGNSGKSLNGICTIGYNEWQDVVGAMKYIKGDNELSKMELGMVVNCMGANSALIALSKEPELFSGVKAVVAVQPVSYNIFIENYVKSSMPIAKKLLPNIEKQAKKLSGISLKDMSPLKYIPNIKQPILYVQVRADKWTVPSDILSFKEATQTESDILWIEGDLTRFDGYNYFWKHPSRMLDWLDKYM